MYILYSLIIQLYDMFLLFFPNIRLAVCLFLGEIAFCSASNFAYCDTFLSGVVCRLSHSCTLLKPFN